MLLSDYNYVLPKSAIAQLPPVFRGEAKLLVLDKKSGKITDRHYAECLEYFDQGDVLVLNNTKVIKARLFAVDADGQDHELVLLEKHGEAEDHFRHKVIYRGQLTVGQTLKITSRDKICKLNITSIEDGGIATVQSEDNLEEITNTMGTVPLPPYMKRAATPDDVRRYQTEFAKDPGSVAAPTASLNMTKDLIKQIEAKGVRVVYLTLHVGLGTFLPIRSDDITEHKMHSEWFGIPSDTVEAIRAAKQSGGRVVAVGTTVARTLEYAATRHPELASKSLSINRELTGEADIFIYPGYKFKLIDNLITNFHAPKSTVLMLTAAFAGWSNLEQAYHYALNNDYRFLSYGDSMLIVD